MTKREVILAEFDRNSEAHRRVRDIQLHLVDIGIDNNVLAYSYSNTVSIREVKTRDELTELLKKLEPHLTPNYVTDINKLSNGYSHTPTNDAVNLISPIMVYVPNAGMVSISGVIIEVNCYLGSELGVYTLNIELSYIKDITTHSTVDAEVDETTCGVTYSNSKVHTDLKNIDRYMCQTHGTHADGLHKYLIWFKDNISIEELLENI